MNAPLPSLNTFCLDTKLNSWPLVPSDMKMFESIIKNIKKIFTETVFTLIKANFYDQI